MLRSESMEPGAQRTILIVDDDGATLLLLSAFLRRNNYRVITADNPIKGLEILQAETGIRLVITDLMMPHVDGMSFTEQIHALEAFKTLPVIMITAHSTDQVIDTGMRRGVALTLSKPLNLNKLLDLVGFASH